ncbi:pirin family protein [Methanosarcina sp. KYL-1]|uniref:pirin family protein n=1 Tax=Methanosarcina sp. KYL-1 TaxID=2602068 RepID=UPI00210112AE|nr:pirin family protein [Methanosarcina sp. KYL-1]MCQ1535725.1 pirin family protein [Methanosarcina sp. KYL-1]
MPTIEGAGVHLKRAFGFNQVPELDPFLLLDDFHSKKPEEYLMGFPWHPHRGIETITYVLHGEVEHGDSMGNSGVIEAGDVQWMTAGSGIIHQEMPKGEKSGLMWGFQLWANLPASHKMMEPRYQEIKSNRIPEIFMGKGLKVRVICGEVLGMEGPVREIVTSPEYLDVTVPVGETFSHLTVPGHTVFAYVIEGRGYFDRERDPYAFEVGGGRYFDLTEECLVGPENLVLYGDGDTVEVTAGDRNVRFLLVSGKPIGEPVAWYGPIVMNTQEELRVAFEEYNKGTFIKHPGRL